MIQFTSRDGTLVMADIEYADAGTRALLLEQCIPSERNHLRQALDKLDAREARFIREATQAKMAIGWGDCFWRGVPGLTIYGAIMRLSDLKASEDAHTVRLAEAAYRRGWRPARCYSAAEPDGEPGEVHVAQMRPLTREQFQAAQAQGWPPMPSDWHQEIYAQMRAHGYRKAGGDHLPDSELIAETIAVEHRPMVLGVAGNLADDLIARYPDLCTHPELPGMLVRIAACLRGLIALAEVDPAFEQFNSMTITAVLGSTGTQLSEHQ